jgi:hypothetical protein
MSGDTQIPPGRWETLRKEASSLFQLSIFLRLQVGIARKAVVTMDILLQPVLVGCGLQRHGNLVTYDGHRKRCSNLGRELRYWGLVICDEWILEVTKIPWSNIARRRRSRPPVVVRL